MKPTETFSSWWDKNYIEYEKLGINKIVAKSIWGAACDSCIEEIAKYLK